MSTVRERQSDKRLHMRMRSARHLMAAMILLPGLGASAAVHAAACSVSVQTDDAMRYTPAHIDVPKSCKNFTVNLTHTGRLPKLAMGHNWVLVKPADLEGVARTGMAAGAEQDYVDARDNRVIAASRVIGPGEVTSVTFPVSKLQAKASYTFFCSFAGHSPIMQGTLSLTP